MPPRQRKEIPVMVNPDPKFQDKHRYIKLKHDGSFVVMEQCEVNDFVDGSDGAYEVDEVWMTTAEYEALPEFMGF